MIKNVSPWLAGAMLAGGLIFGFLAGMVWWAEYALGPATCAFIGLALMAYLVRDLDRARE